MGSFEKRWKVASGLGESLEDLAVNFWGKCTRQGEELCVGIYSMLRLGSLVGVLTPFVYLGQFLLQQKASLRRIIFLKRYRDDKLKFRMMYHINFLAKDIMVSTILLQNSRLRQRREYSAIRPGHMQVATECTRHSFHQACFTKILRDT